MGSAIFPSAMLSTNLKTDLVFIKGASIIIKAQRPTRWSFNKHILSNRIVIRKTILANHKLSFMAFIPLLNPSFLTTPRVNSQVNKQHRWDLCNPAGGVGNSEQWIYYPVGYFSKALVRRYVNHLNTFILQVWDHDLANFAKKLSRTCNFVHSNGPCM